MDWEGLLRAGLQGLRLSPEAFWRLSPIELRLMLGLEQGAPPLSRAHLAQLLSTYPDEAALKQGAQQMALSDGGEDGGENVTRRDQCHKGGALGL